MATAHRKAAGVQGARVEVLTGIPEWLRLEAQPRYEIPGNAISIQQFAEALGIKVARAGIILNQRVKTGEMTRQWTGKKYMYWPVK